MTEWMRDDSGLSLRDIDVDDWCSLCLLVHDVRDLASELPSTPEGSGNG